MEELATIDGQADKGLTFQERFQNPITNEDTAKNIGGTVSAGVY